jgi:hypothetical protein
VTAFPLAGLVTFASLVGILNVDTYARETADWRGQAIGQDWADLLIAVPWLMTAGLLASRGSRRGSLLLAAGLLYTFYEFVIYAFGLRFNALFLPYCAALGVSFFALAWLGFRIVRTDVRAWYQRPPPVRSAAATLFVIGISFTLLWLSEIVPALLNGTSPRSVAVAGTLTNPVHVIDLSIVLPAHLLAAASLLRRRPLGLVLAPILLGFDVLMALSLAGMMWVMRLRGLQANLAVALAMLVLAVVSGLCLARLLRALRSAHE